MTGYTQKDMFEATSRAFDNGVEHACDILFHLLEKKLNEKELKERIIKALNYRGEYK